MSPESAEVVRSYLDARNRGKVRAALRSMHRSISYLLVGGWKKVGRREVRRLEEWGKAMGCHLEAEEVVDHGEWVYCSLRETNHWLPMMDIAPIVYERC